MKIDELGTIAVRKSLYGYRFSRVIAEVQVSESNEHDPNDPNDPITAPDLELLQDKGAAKGAKTIEESEEKLDLSAVERELAAMASEENEALKLGGARVRRRRSPVLSLVVLVFGAYLLQALWADFRYWLEPGQAEDLGELSEVYSEGKFTENFNNRHIVFNGTPDIQHAARVPVGEAFMGFLRIGEAEGALFAAIPRATKEAPSSFESRFSGRMMRLADAAIGEPLQDFFDAEEIVQIVDLDKTRFLHDLEGSEAGALSITTAIEGQSRSLTIDAADVLRFVMDSPDAMVQLGRTTWRRHDDAVAAIESLGMPYLALERPHAPYWSFRVRLDHEHAEALEARLNAEHAVPKDNADPKIGALVLSRNTSYLVDAHQVQLHQGQLSFVYGENTSDHGFEIEAGKLVERALVNDRLNFPQEAIFAIRVERKIEVDTDGYVVLVGNTPEKHQLAGILFLLVCGLMGLNGFSLLLALRRKQAA